jgi:hypothetical protein
LNKQLLTFVFEAGFGPVQYRRSARSAPSKSFWHPEVSTSSGATLAHYVPHEGYAVTVTVTTFDLTLPSPKFWRGGISRATDMVYLPGWLKS